MHMISKINIKDYNYNLEDNRVAKYPLENRDASKLLVYQNNTVKDSSFHNLSKYLPEKSFMVFNDTKVVPARLHFQKDTGAHIEIFCLEPINPPEYVTIFSETKTCIWKCIVGNIKRWKSGTLSVYNPNNDLETNEISLTADLIEREGETSCVKFSWKKNIAFSKVLEICGKIPIPPYLNRNTEVIDIERYQTLYAKFRGSVAAPTAGLHFTDKVLLDIDNKGIKRVAICLHVGAGTFLPVKSDYVVEHKMHREPFVVSLSFLKELRNSLGKVIAVGTTSVRTLESLYYAGVSCIESLEPKDIEQWIPYEKDYDYTTEEALDALINYMEMAEKSTLQLGTQIIIVPGFKFRIVDILITNFHQPQSTLLLLVSAFVGGNWKKIYEYALKNNFRFLSYGDSSLLFRES